MKRSKWLMAVLVLTGITLLWGASSSPGQTRRDDPKQRAGTRAERMERLKMQQALPLARRAAAARFKQQKAQVLGRALAKARRQPLPLPQLDPLISPLVFWPLAGLDNEAPRSGPMADAMVATGAAADPQILAPPIPDPLGIPHYFGPYSNYANSPMPRGIIASLTLVSGGSGYVSPAVVIEDVYNTGSGAAATPLFDPASGTITGITLTSPGTNYTAPIAYIVDTGGPGTGADALAVIGPPFTGGLRKFVDRVALLDPTTPNEIGQYIPVAVPDTTAYPGSHYYEIELGLYDEQLHSDLGPTRLAGYRQTNTTDANVSQFHYLGPLIIAQKGIPVRIKFTNSLPTEAGGDLFIPVDTTLMGAGETPNGTEQYTQNRANLHLHGGDNPWISDGTPYQWTTPAGEATSYPKGVSVYNVPDMPDPGRTAQQGVLTYYYPNEQSARLLFYHDHAVGITRLNVYAGEAAGYLLTDAVEADLMNGTNTTGVNTSGGPLLPGVGIPLIIQDKTFVDPLTIISQDPTWFWGRTPGTPALGDLWMPHVYMPNQNPADLSGMNAFGRWHYGPWFWPPTTQIAQGPVLNPYYDPINAPWEPQYRPGTPNPSMAMEAFMDTPMVNGTVYPYMEVEPKLYRFRILNVCNDRFVNLQLYKADPTVVTADGRTMTEVHLVPAVVSGGFPQGWPVDGREGGVPDPTLMGPDWIQLGTEGGFLPYPVVIPPQPVGWNLNQTNFNFGLVNQYSLLLGPAERADVLVDFSAFAGQTLILYNDAPAAFPALDPRYDYYTGMVDQVTSGGTPTTQPGFGPSTRTIMQIRVGGSTSGTVVPLNMAGLQAAFTKAGTKPSVFAASQHPIIVPTSEYDAAYEANFPADQYARIFDQSKTFQTIEGTTLTIPLQPKAIQDEMGEAFDIEYGRMSGFLGVQLPAQAGAQQFTLYPYGSPPVEIIKAEMTPLAPVAGDGTQLWKITHNGVDTHTIHFHLFNVQMVNRVAWDNAVAAPDPNELGWKETIRVNPLEDTIIALRAVVPTLPFDLPNSNRPIDLSKPLGAVLPGGPFGFKDPQGVPVSVINHDVNWGWEYVLHCHLLGHEEMDMMHGQAIVVAPRQPTGLTGVQSLDKTSVSLTWADNSLNETGFTVQRSGTADFAVIQAETSYGIDVTAHNDTGLNPATNYFWRVIADNVVGDLDTPGFPLLNGQSVPSNVFGAGPNGVITIQLTAPNGGESFAVGSTQNVTWTQTGLAGTANIDLYKAGLFVKPLGTADVTAGTFSWVIDAAEPAGTDYRIRVSQGGAFDDSDLDFALVVAGVRSDFNGDGQPDILWRYNGAGGANLVWFLSNAAPPVQPLALTAPSTASPAAKQAILGRMSAALREKGAARAMTGQHESIESRDVTELMRTQGLRGVAISDPRRVGKAAGQPAVRTLADPRQIKTTLGAQASDIQLAAAAFMGSADIPSVPDLLWEAVGTGDFNNDTHVDILWRYNGPGGANIVWLMNGTNPTGIAELPAVGDLNWRVASTGDFNNDSSIDILWHYNGPGAYNVVWFMNGATPTSIGVMPAVADQNWQIVGTGDFDNSGSLDLLWRYGAAGGHNVVWFMSGLNPTGAALLPAVADLNWQIVGTADYDDDTFVDILWRFNGTGGVNIIWYMNGVNPIGIGELPPMPDLSWMIVSR